MNFFKKLSTLFSSPPSRQDADSYWLTVQCHRCGEVIRARVNLLNDLSLEFGEGEKTTYFCRKVLMGAGQCFQRVEVELTFDGNRKLLSRNITGGKWVET
ncbi:MAG: hypothetical protein HUU38_05935 [Anaerolineales bacterium]|jgi:hypothetical protein|nr:hypothetical protein [Anaerolineales bacterium]